MLDRYEPQAVILVAGASPLMRPLQHQTWETFSVNWHTDVRIAFYWIREALLKPVRPAGRVVVVSSGAALNGSPLSGGYAGAKATQRFITAYAQDEANRVGLDITFTAVLPRITPLTDLGRPAVQAYAARSGQSEEAYLRQFGEPLTPEAAGAALGRAGAGRRHHRRAELPPHQRRTANTGLRHLHARCGDRRGGRALRRSYAARVAGSLTMTPGAPCRETMEAAWKQ